MHFLKKMILNDITHHFLCSDSDVRLLTSLLARERERERKRERYRHRERIEIERDRHSEI